MLRFPMLLAKLACRLCFALFTFSTPGIESCSSDASFNSTRAPFDSVKFRDRIFRAFLLGYEFLFGSLLVPSLRVEIAYLVEPADSSAPECLLLIAFDFRKLLTCAIVYTVSQGGA
ncbi:hypothetical protein BCR33DRAFT_319215 [Rhizoclosmatium globosum]|uniref:Secreted protein n=1 Tax=Rhizoclosmatium globosum TaxID=329046 RepID=A0A1Y2D1P3_9FUNG|nr:hypothetical protein BCR33DRAFT_319215 [Rhizoclosmatium globosum]|eukprot:ORY52505.1 hypothetical protein BCR33DRAFT_319215 [Rhizoclosmatium globosum]